MAKIITYDLRKERNSDDYKKLYDVIEKQGETIRILESVWMVYTTKTSEQLRDFLLPYIDKDDGIFIADMANGQGSWSNLDADDYSVKALFKK